MLEFESALRLSTAFRFGIGFALLLVLVSASVLLGDESHAISFDIDVMAVLSKSGCNAGTCHGNQNGKGGFKLSLRGQNPEADYDSIVRQFSGRRISRLQPDQSLLLLKPLAETPHQGGRRFQKEDWQHTTLRSWIASGLPRPNSESARLLRIEISPREEHLVDPESVVQLQVKAIFSDGHERNVTEKAVYETSDSIARVTATGAIERQNFGETTIIVRFLQLQVPVRVAFIPARPDFVWSDPPCDNYIDRAVFEKLRGLRINPSLRADDHTLVRRTYLDVLGVLPTAEQARSFVFDQRLDKYSRLVDEMLAKPEFADHWALKWSDLLRCEEKVLDVKGVEVYYNWIRESLASDKPIDQFVRELIAARGSTYKNPPANFWRASRDPFTRAETTARLFLGTRLQCAKCHNHPFERWTQDNYYSWAALFARIDYEIVENKRKDKFDKHEFVGEQLVKIKDEGEVENVRTGQDAIPSFLGGETPDLNSSHDRLESLAQWITADENELFARSQANFVWYQIMGRGLVDPIDDFRATNPPVNSELMNSLVADFRTHDFSLRHLARSILNSRTYQFSAVPNETNGEDTSNFSRAIVRRLTAEQLLDAQSQVLDLPARFAGFKSPIRAGQIPGVRKVRPRDGRPEEGDRFLMTFGKPERLLACECERSNETTLKQVFELVCGHSLNGRVEQRGGRLEELAMSDLLHEETIHELCWTTLGRPATEHELENAKEWIEERNDRFVALQDISWAFMNAKEFNFRR